jgi:hypothetical protein
MNLPLRTIRLATDPSQNGLYCGPDGVTLGGIPLLKETASGFSPHDPFNLQHLFDMAYGAGAIDASQYARRLAHVANALNKGDLPLAMIGGLLLKLPDVPVERFGRRGEIGLESKLAFDEDQPRDADGRWTLDPSGESRQSSPTVEPPKSAPIISPVPEPAAEPAEASRLARLAPRVVGLAARLAALVAEAVPLAIGFCLIPLNRSNIRYGALPGLPGFNYRSDEGAVTISRLDAAGHVEHINSGLPDAQGYYHDSDGYIIGQNVGTGVLFDNDALTELAAKPAKAKVPNTDFAPLPGISANADYGTPKVCPPPTPEDITKRSARSLAYQSQITGLPIGWDVLLNGVRFDGCDNVTQRMQEANGLMGDYLLMLNDDQLRKSEFYYTVMDQAMRQNIASAGRGVDWYFADERFYEFFKREFSGQFPNISVHFQEAIIKKIEECIYWVLYNFKSLIPYSVKIKYN